MLVYLITFFFLNHTRRRQFQVLFYLPRKSTEAKIKNYHDSYRFQKALRISFFVPKIQRAKNNQEYFIFVYFVGMYFFNNIIYNIFQKDWIIDKYKTWCGNVSFPDTLVRNKKLKGWKNSVLFLTHYCFTLYKNIASKNTLLIFQFLKI